MLFNSIQFIVFFIIVLASVAVIKKRKFQHLFLLLASYFFFYYSSNYLIVLLIYSTLLDFYLGGAIYKSSDPVRRKMLLICSMAGNLGLLGFFKYADFAISQFNALGTSLGLGSNIPLLNLVLPIGISFYTFHTMTYTIDIYRGQLVPSKTFREFALFVTFFPSLVAGPILRASQILPQFREQIAQSEVGTKVGSRLKLILLEESNLKFGVTMMAFGFLKKMLFSDNISPMVNDIFNYPVGAESFTIILATIGFGIQIYCDFSGYSDIAIGAAMILGFKIPANFNRPYFATSPSDFWRRWHIALSSWLRDYLYITLGGNRVSKVRTYLNLFITMFLGGLWHGASWNFVIWGMLHGAYLAAHKAILDKFPSLKGHKFFTTKLGIVFSIFVTQYLVFLTWIPFRVQDPSHLTYSIWKYIVWDFAVDKTISVILANKLPILLIAGFIALHYISYKKGNLLETISGLKLRYWIVFLVAVTFSILILYDGKPEDFIYFRF